MTLIFQIKGWQVVKRAIGSRPRVPKSRAICDTFAPGNRVRPTASRLNSSLYRFLCCMTLLLPHHGA
ncbi:hypothetical protein EV148_11422 [Dokdonella fugitiva]|jgi:hypothetical protein|uniref:Uncharacterized protein n=1 Tax=Dokdonella fugitiva TaxID=328517 RepID=A0A4R2HX00_9GAMM|nr:hypothetical protein EV148_11422 [Dokdonella fugitiva]